jgi:hypothetical protein
MKQLTLILSILFFAASLRAQEQQRIDTVPSSSQWVRSYTPSHKYTSLSYISADTCWAWSDDLGELISSNGGTTWSATPMPAYMLNAHFGYVFGPQFYRTKDAWRSYDSTLNPFQNNQYLTFAYDIVDTSYAFVVNDDEIARTNDGGLSWKQYTVPVLGLTGISFANRKVGYAVGPEAWGPGPNQTGGSCLKTSDSGRSWHQIYTGAPGNFNSVYAVSDSVVIAVGGGDDIPGYGRQIIYRTTDGGTTWSRIHSPDTFHGIGYIVMRGAIGYIAGSPSFMLRTSDTGKTWVKEQLELTSATRSLVTPRMYGDSLVAVAGSDSGLIFFRRPGQASVPPRTLDSLSVAVFPNPAQQSITLQYVLPQPESSNVTIFSMTGELLQRPAVNMMQGSGPQSIVINTTELASGNYIYQLSSQDYSSSGIFTISK